MRRWAWLALVPLAGCFGIGDGPTLYLEYTIQNLGDESRFAGLGPHCGDARVEGDVAHVEKRAYASIGERRPFLIVEPNLGPSSNGSFVTLGSEGFPATLPATIDTYINHTRSVIAQIDYRDEKAYVNGQAVTLPHAWSDSRSGDWSATFLVSRGPNQVKLFERPNCM